MKKSVKIISIMLVIMIALTTFTSTAFAATKDGGSGSLSSEIQNMANGNGTKIDAVTNLGGTIVSVMQTVGIVVAVVVILVIGIKYMMGSAEEKAEYKKTMIPYLVGAILLFAATTVVNVVYSIANSLNSSGAN